MSLCAAPPGAKLRGSDVVLLERESRMQSQVSEEVQWLETLRALGARLRAYCYAVSHDRDHTEELLAEIRLRAWIERSAICASTDPERELIQIARACCKEYARRRRYEIPTIGDVMAEKAETPSCASLSVEEAIARRSWCDEILGRLSEQQRVAVDLRVRWSLPYDIVAGALGAAEGTARVHVLRGLRRLRELTGISAAS